MVGHRGYYRDGWEAVTLHQPLTPFSDAEWELYDLHDRPDRDDEPGASDTPSWWPSWQPRGRQAAAGQVYPLDEGSGVKFLVAPVAVRRVRRARDDPAGHADAGALAVAAAGRQPVLRGHRRSWRRGARARWSRTATRAAATRCTSRTASCGSPTTTAAAGPGSSAVRWRRRAVVEARLHRAGRRDLVGRAYWLTGSRSPRATGFALLFPMAPFQGIDVGLDTKSPVVWGRGSFPYTGVITLGDLHARRPRSGLPRDARRHPARHGPALRVAPVPPRWRLGAEHAGESGTNLPTTGASYSPVTPSMHWRSRSR